jgi:hypothetical protein
MFRGSIGLHRDVLWGVFDHRQYHKGKQAIPTHLRLLPLHMSLFFFELTQAVTKNGNISNYSPIILGYSPEISRLFKYHTDR